MKKSLHTCPESYLGMLIVAAAHGICVCIAGQNLECRGMACHYNISAIMRIV